MLNQGFDPEVIEKHRSRMVNGLYYIVDSEDNSSEYVNFFFVGKHKVKEVMFDSVIYTLRLSHGSELYEIAEHEAAKRFPNFKKITYEEDENGDLAKLDGEAEEIGLFMAEVMMELEDEGSVKVQERVEIDEFIDFGIGLDVALNVDEITPDVIQNFIEQFNAGTLKLDETLYTFTTEDEELAD